MPGRPFQILYFLYRYMAGFCPHWSAVVGSNHHSAFLTITQLMFDSIYSIFNMGESLFYLKEVSWRLNFDHHSMTPRCNRINLIRL